MRPGIRILTGGMCMLAGMLMQFIPGVESWPAWQILAGVLILAGGLLFYLGCRRAARLAEKAYGTSRNREASAPRAVRLD